MKDFGLGKHSIDERIQDEAASLVEIFHQKSNTAFDPQDDITKSIGNIICSITFGKRYSVKAKYQIAGHDLGDFLHYIFLGEPVK